MLLIEHFVAPSSIHGLGVFSATFVPQGAKVWTFHPAIDRIIYVSDLAGLPGHVVQRIKTHSEYLREMEAFIISADGDYYMNHCDNPNIENRDGEKFAIRDIREGEELHFDYGQTLALSVDLDTRVRHQRVAADTKI